MVEDKIEYMIDEKTEYIVEIAKKLDNMGMEIKDINRNLGVITIILIIWFVISLISIGITLLYNI